MEADSAGPERPFTCELCPKKYLRKNNMQDHVLMEHPNSMQASEIIEYKARNGRCKTTLIIECDICSKRFRYQSDMKNHYESHFRPRGRGAKISIMGSPRSGSVDSGGPISTKSTPPLSSGIPAVVAATLAAATANSPSMSPVMKTIFGTPGRGAPGVMRGPYQPRKTRPCLYCGRIFADKEELRRHELWEAAEFEQEALEFEMETAGGSARGGNSYRVKQSDFESQSEKFQQLIDRTDEEFGGEDSCNGHYSPPPPAVVDTTSRTVPSGASTGPLLNTTSPVSYKEFVSEFQLQQRHLSAIVVATYNTQYNHTSQYTSLDPGGPVTGEPPPPAHEGDQLVAQNGFLPPPPPLPVPQFAAQGCHNRGPSDAEFPDPNEERTYTRLTSEDESHTCSSLLQVNGMSPSREVLDLSLPKQPDAAVAANDLTRVDSKYGSASDSLTAAADPVLSDNCDENAAKSEIYNGDVVKSEIPACNGDVVKSDIHIGDSINLEICNNIASNSSGEDDIDLGGGKPPGADPDEEQDMIMSASAADQEEIVFFEPGSVPSMPEANLSTCQPLKGEEDTTSVSNVNGLGSDMEWKTTITTLNCDYSHLMEYEEDEEEEDNAAASLRKSCLSSPVQFEDPNRLDCKFCGMIFEAPHVRQFHEASHDEELEEYDGELTRLFCGFCGKTFKKAQYRILHEKGHTGELAICCAYCDRRFRWESELRNHNRIFCTPERPAKPLSLKKSSARPLVTATTPEAKQAATTTPTPLTKLNGNAGLPRRTLGAGTERDDQWASHPNLPTGWRQRCCRQRPDNGQQQPYMAYMEPGGQVFHSRRAVLQYMEAAGEYSRTELKRMRLHCKSGPRGRRPKSLLEDEDDNSNSMDMMAMDTASNLDYPDSSNAAVEVSLDNSVDEDHVGGGSRRGDELEGEMVEGKRKKFRFSDRRLLPKRRVNKA